MLVVFFSQYSLVVLSLIVAQIIAVVLWILMNAEVSNFNCLMAFTYTWRQFLEILYMQEQKGYTDLKGGRGSRLSPPPGKLKYQSNLDNKIIIKIWSPTPFPHSRQIKLSPRTLSWKKLGKLSGSEIDYFWYKWNFLITFLYSLYLKFWSCYIKL